MIPAWVKVAIAVSLFAMAVTGVHLYNESLRNQGYQRALAEHNAQLIAAQEQATKDREQSAKDYAAKSKELQDEITSHETYRRCIAAGRCGVRVVAASCPAVSPSAGVDAPRPDAIPVADEPAEKLANECAVTTLMLNSLQKAIERQPGY